MKINYHITVEGSIGVGKTSLAKILAEEFQAQLILENLKKTLSYQSFIKILNNMHFKHNYSFYFQDINNKMNLNKQIYLISMLFLIILINFNNYVNTLIIQNNPNNYIYNDNLFEQLKIEGVVIINDKNIDVNLLEKQNNKFKKIKGLNNLFYDLIFSNNIDLFIIFCYRFF